MGLSVDLALMPSEEPLNRELIVKIFSYYLQVFVP